MCTCKKLFFHTSFVLFRPGSHQVRGRVKPGQVTSPLQNQIRNTIISAHARLKVILVLLINLTCMRLLTSLYINVIILKDMHRAASMCIAKLHLFAQVQVVCPYLCSNCFLSPDAGDMRRHSWWRQPSLLVLATARRVKALCNKRSVESDLMGHQ